MGPRIDRSRLFPPELDSAERDRRALALDLAEAALAAVEPYACTRAALDRFGERLDGATLFAFGKAAGAMARAACDAIDVKGGIAIVLEPIELPHIEVRLGSHPMPAEDAEETGRAVLALAERLGPGDRALCLVSGGGSAMLELPKEGVSMASIASLSRALMERGADIAELNAVRRGLSRLKGGGLARAISPASIFNVVISDVPGHPPEIVASGPTCAPPDGEPIASIRTEIAADNAAARAAIAARGLRDREGYFSGEARALGARIAGEVSSDAWVWGGESTVTVRGKGRGGRNQELVLGALAGWSRGLLLSIGTDGADGSSDAAGALIDPAAVRACAALGLDPAGALADNQSHAFFDALGTQLRTGRTGTNVADLCIYLP